MKLYGKLHITLLFLGFILGWFMGEYIKYKFLTDESKPNISESQSVTFLNDTTNED